MSRYEVIRPIAKGGMAEVLLARSVGEGGFAKEVALKRIIGGMGRDDQTVRMLMDEARLAARLTHPNIVQVFDFGRDEEGYYIAMEYVPGPELTRVLGMYEKRGERPPEAAMIAVMIQVLRGLDYAHRLVGDDGKPMGLVHRDVSPSNILLTVEGVAKVSDFGIAKATGRLSETQVGMVKGKIPYMSPEQTYGMALDQRSDVFGAGLVLWECLAGRRCYEGEVDVAVMALAAAGNVAPLAALGIGIPAALSKIVERATAKEVADRYQTAGEAAQALESYHRQAHPAFTSETLGEVVRQVLAEPQDDGRNQADVSTDRAAANSAAPPAANPPSSGDWEAPPGLESRAPAGPDFFGRRKPAEAGAPPPPARGGEEPEPAPAKPAFRRPRLEAGEGEKSSAEGSGRSPDWKSMVPPTTQTPPVKFAEGPSPEVRTRGRILSLVGVVVGVAMVMVIGLMLYDRSKEESAAKLSEPSAASAPTPADRAPLPGSTPKANNPAGSRSPETRQRNQEAAAAATPGEGAFLDIRCEPWCEIQIDGKPSGYRSPAPKIPVSPGTHHLRLSNPEVHLEKRATLVVNPGETLSRYFNLVLGP